jgi:hypothetical protein
MPLFSFLLTLSVSVFAETVIPTLINGTEVDPLLWKPVVRIVSGNSGCSATIVGPRVFLTAAHCANTNAKATFSVNGKTYSATITRSPLYSTDDHDLSVGVTTEVIQGVTPISIGGIPSRGQGIMLLGYGCTTVDATGSDGKLRMGRSVVADVSGVRFSSTTPKGPLLCPGDSGGPAFVQAGDRLNLIGVNSAVGVSRTGTITGPNYNARTDGPRFQEVIRTIAQRNNVQVCGVTTECDSPIEPQDPSCELVSSAETIRQGDPLTLTLSSKNATSGQIDGVSVSVPTGQRIVVPEITGSQTATGRVANAAGKTAMCSKTYFVTPRAEPPLLACDVTATPGTVKVGERVTLELNARGGAAFGSIDGVPVDVPQGKRIVDTREKGDFSVLGFVRSSTGASANCSTYYRAEDGGVIIPDPLPYTLVPNYCGSDSNGATSGVSRVCMATLKKDPLVTHTGFLEALTVTYSDGSGEVLPIAARRPVAASSTQDELALFANGVVSGASGATLDMRLATVLKNASGMPTSIEGKTKLNKNFRVSLTPQ